jgi:hypothetical protein
VLWHFCVNCEIWPQRDFVETLDEHVASPRCPLCQAREAAGTCARQS